MPRNDKRHEIMQAAEKLFTSRRFHEITLDDVAASAGVGKGTIYRHFRDKDDLFFRTATAGFDELCGLISRKVHGEAPFSEQLVDACEGISTFLDRRRPLFRMMQTEDGRPTRPSLRSESGDRGMFHRSSASVPPLRAGRAMWREKQKALLTAVASVLRKGVDEGRLRRDIPPEVLASYLLAMLRTRTREATDVSCALRRLEVITDLFYRGASPDAKEPKREGHPRVST